jgi:hypothetical protein
MPFKKSEHKLTAGLQQCLAEVRSDKNTLRIDVAGFETVTLKLLRNELTVRAYGHDVEIVVPNKRYDTSAEFNAATNNGGPHDGT